MTASCLPEVRSFPRRLRWRPIWISLAALAATMMMAFLAGCRMDNVVERFADDQKEAIAQRYQQYLLEGDFEAIERELDPALLSPDTRERLQAMRKLIPSGTPVARNLVGYYINKKLGGPTRYDLTYQLDYGSAWLIAYIAWTEDDAGKRNLALLRIQPLSEPLQRTHALNFERARPRHYVFAAVAAGVFVFSAISLIACIRTKFPRRKWLWILFILGGVGQLTFNWTTGDIGFVPISLQFLSAGLVAASAYSPWTLGVSLPLGAIMFWFKRRRLLRAAEPPPVPPPVAA